MELKRDIYKDLLNWKKEANGKKALLIEGARRVGKSTIAQNFAKNEYKSYILVDFTKASKKVKDNFENLDNLDIFFQNLSFEYNTRLFKRDSLIIFDEIQKFPRAREAIKYLVLDGRYDYIETGSLISIKENVSDITIPSEEKKIKMYPLTFKEFMISLNEEILLEHIISCFEKRVPLEQNIHQKALRIFSEYMLVGGMPQSVVAYIENDRDFYQSDIEKRYILELYRDDIKKASKKYTSKVSAIFENIPGFLSANEKRVKLSEAKENGVYSQFEDSFYWLDDSMICNICYKCNDPNVGFSLNKNPSFLKCYMGDTGLLVSLAFSENEISKNLLYKNIIDGNLSLNKGMLYENIVAQMLVASGQRLYYYSRYNDIKHRNDIEIDFLISNESKTKFKIFPIEVKSSKNYKTSSLNEFENIYKNRVETSYIIHPKNLVCEKGLVKLPSYMTFCLFL